ncbi:succinylglutamate desuccinylase/aspartoacylase family protein [Planctomicrobium sp. SH664]|uniref:succinylglutamate desuccinylase/aspartoacylase family protein n=1 Tax=Planctomicrobium sp. SH664 TaxID=3448125 RepID=UPI003F5AEB72
MMKFREKKRTVAEWNGETIGPGESRDLALDMSASYSGQHILIPLHVRRGLREGPTVFVTAAVHGDEINGAGAIRELILDPSLQLEAGSLILVPVVNVLGFERHSRYLPDRRDLNRSFPGSSKGSLAARLARLILDEIVERSDYGIDLHTAAVRRTNFPNTRGDLSHPEIQTLAEVFGCELIVNEKGPTGCLRRSACDAGCPTFILEAGEVWKAEALVIEYALRGIRNVLMHFGMIQGVPSQPPFRTVIQETLWVRSDTAGFLKFHVAPGDFVRRGDPLATTTSLTGQTGEVLTAPQGGVVLGMTTLPVTSPGEPVVHIGLVHEGQGEVEQVIRALPPDALHHRIRSDLSSSIMVVPPASPSSPSATS